MVHIENSSSLYKNYHQILLKFEEISFQSISSLDSFYKNHAKKENISLKQKLEGFKTDHSDAKAHLMKKLEIYKIFAFEIKKISLVQILEFSSPRAKKQDEILKSSFSAIFSLLHSQKTINKIAKKITIGIPFIQFNLSDDMFPFFELLESFRIILSEMDELKHGQKKNEQTSKNKYFETLLKSTAKIQENATSQQKQSNSGKPNSLHEPSTNFGQAKQNNVRQGVADDILIKEFQELCEKHNPKEKIKNCKHCALKKMQSSLLLNIIFGDFPSYFNDFKKTDFYLLDIWMNRNKSISFKDDSESSENGIKILFKTSQKSNPSCCTQIHLPIIIITFDQGFFKNNFTIHTAKAHNPLKNAHGFQTNVILKPFLDVDENILTSMEEKFYLYCHHLDERIPTFLKTEDTDKKEFNDKQIFLVCYRKMISMRDLLESYDGDFQKNRNIFFMKLTEIGAIFQDSSSMIPLINLVRNLTSFKKKFSKFLKSELAYMMLIPDDYDIASYSNEFCEKSGKQRDMSGIQLLKYLENETLYFSVERFYIQFLNMYLNCDNSLNSFQKTPQSIIFQIHNLGVFLTAVNVREIKTIFSIDLIRLSFTSNMQFLLEKINLGKKDDAFLFDLKTIRMVSNRNEKIILIPENEYQDDLLALRIYIKLFSEKIEKIKINIEASQIELSMKTINELVEVLNVPILLSNMEHKEFKVFLKGSILQMEYKGISKDFNKLFENVFNKKEHSISNSFKKSSKVVKVDLYSKNYDVVLELNKLTIRLLERQVFLI